MDDIKQFAKNEKRIKDSNTNNKNSQTGKRNDIWNRKMYQSNYKKQEKNPEGIEQPSLGVKKTYKYLGILEADNIKQVEM